MFQVFRIVPLVMGLLLLSACGAGNFLEWPKTATVPDSDWAQTDGLERLSIAHPNIEGLQVSYVRAGDPTGQRVIFVHGSPGDSSTYRRYLANVPEGFEYITIDRPGFGFTTPVKSFKDLGGQAASVEPLLKGGNGEPAILVGWSYGGPVIVQAAADYPDRVKGLVVQAGALDPELEKVRFVQRLGNVWPFSRFVDDTWRIANEELIPLDDELEELAPKLSGITAPTVILHGDDDDFVPIGNVDYMQANMTGVSDLHIERYPGYGHSIPFTKYNDTVAAISRLNEGYAVPAEFRLTTAALIDGIRAGDIDPFSPKLGEVWFGDGKSALAELRSWANARDSHEDGKAGIEGVRDLEMCAAEPIAYSLSRYFEYLDGMPDLMTFKEDFIKAVDTHDVLVDAIDRSVQQQAGGQDLTPLANEYLARGTKAITGSQIAEIYEDANFSNGVKSEAGKTLLANLGVAGYCAQKLDNRQWLEVTLKRDGWPTKEKAGGDISIAAIRLLVETDDASLIQKWYPEIKRLVEDGEIDKAALERLDTKLEELEGV